MALCPNKKRKRPALDHSPPCEDSEKATICKLEVVLIGTQPSRSPDLQPPSLHTVRKTSFKPPSLWYSVMAA